MMSAAREQSCVWWAPSGCPETEKFGLLEDTRRAVGLQQPSHAADRPRHRRRRRATTERTRAGVVERGGGNEEGALRVRRRQEDKSGAKDLHDGLAEEARNPGLTHVHPCCGLQPGWARPRSSNSRSNGVSSSRETGIMVKMSKGEAARKREEQLVRQQRWCKSDRTGAARHCRCCALHRQTSCHHSRETWRAEESLDTKSCATSSVCCVAAPVGGACPACVVSVRRCLEKASDWPSGRRTHWGQRLKREARAMRSSRPRQPCSVTQQAEAEEQE